MARGILRLGVEFGLALTGAAVVPALGSQMNEKRARHVLMVVGVSRELEVVAPGA